MKLFRYALILSTLSGFSHISAAQQCDSPTIELENAFPQLPAVARAVDMKSVPPTGDLWAIAQRAGRIQTFENSATAAQLSTMLDIRKKVDVRLEMGLTGFALHPRYPEDARLFVAYNDKQHDGRSTLSSFAVDPLTHIADANSELVLLTLQQPALNHNGGYLMFGPDGKLYTAFGDGGYDRSSSQNLTNLYGTVLRLDINHQPYRAPKDNPFNQRETLCTQGVNANLCPEIFAYGFRNPWRFSFDSKTQQMWLADVGEHSFEEVNRVNAGNNYGWPIMEGSLCFDNKPCSKEGLTLPVTGYDNPGTQSIVGGYVYRGSQSPALSGHYIFTDTFAPMLYSIAADAQEGSALQHHFNTGLKVASMAQGLNGEIYLLNFEAKKGDVIFRVRQGSTEPCKKDKSL